MWPSPEEVGKQGDWIEPISIFESLHSPAPSRLGGDPPFCCPCVLKAVGYGPKWNPTMVPAPFAKLLVVDGCYAVVEALVVVAPGGIVSCVML